MQPKQNIGNSILPSNNDYILRPSQWNDGILQVRPLYEEDTHSLFFTKDGTETVIASHPNGFSCRELADRIVKGDTERINHQSEFIIACGGTAKSLVEILKL